MRGQGLTPVGLAVGLSAIAMVAIFMASFPVLRAQSAQRAKGSGHGATGLDVSVRYSLAGSETRGTLFEWRAGSERCSAGFVDSLQSRVFANSGELEFWCRRKGDHPLGRFRALPKPNPNAPQSRVANVDGRLVELDSQRVYDFESRDWDTAAWPDGVETAYTVQRSGGRRVITGTSSDCPGLGVWVDGGYRGSIALPDGGSSYSAVTVTGDTVWINMDGATRRGSLLAESDPDDCRSIDLTTVGATSDWVYGYEPVGNSVLFGGVTHAPNDCAAFYRTDGSSLDRVPVEARGESCHNRWITEWYSYTQDRRGLLIGAYPEGTLLRYLPSGEVRETSIAAPTKADWINRITGARYRESQSMVSTMGLVLVGLYPWSEVLQVDEQSHTSHRQRLLTRPIKRAKTALPYFGQASRFARAHTSGGPLRESPLYPFSWGQRVPTIAVLDGKVCASSGNLGGVVYDPRLHPYLPPAVAHAYGTVFCAPTRNQTLASGDLPRQGDLRFSVSGGRLAIYLNGTEIASRADSLRPAELRALSHGHLRLGSGPYGALSGNVSRGS